MKEWETMQTIDETKPVSTLLLTAKAETLKLLLISELRTQQPADEIQDRAKNLAVAINTAFDCLTTS